MKKIILSKSATILVDLVLLLLLVIFFILKDGEKQWHSAHCIFSFFWILLMGFHVIQHQKPAKKSKLTTLITLGFLILVLSILFFCVGFNTPFLTFHKITGISFIVLVIIHVASNFKQFFNLFKSENTIP